MATKKRVNAREARREQALGDIVNGMAGAFGDYVRSQLAANPGGQGNFNGNNVVGSGQGNFNGNGPGFNPGQMMGARGPLPMAAPPPAERPLGASMGAMVPGFGWARPAGDGTGGAPLPPPIPPLMGAPEPRLDGNGPPDFRSYLDSVLPDPNFIAPNVPMPPSAPGREVVFEDGSTATIGGGFDPGFWADRGAIGHSPIVSLLLYLDSLRSSGIGQIPTQRA